MTVSTTRNSSVDAARFDEHTDHTRCDMSATPKPSVAASRPNMGEELLGNRIPIFIYPKPKETPAQYEGWDWTGSGYQPSEAMVRDFCAYDKKRGCTLYKKPTAKPKTKRERKH